METQHGDEDPEIGEGDATISGDEALDEAVLAVRSFFSNRIESLRIRRCKLVIHWNFLGLSNYKRVCLHSLHFRDSRHHQHLGWNLILRDDSAHLISLLSTPSPFPHLLKTTRLPRIAKQTHSSLQNFSSSLKILDYEFAASSL